MSRDLPPQLVAALDAAAAVAPPLPDDVVERLRVAMSEVKDVCPS